MSHESPSPKSWDSPGVPQPTHEPWRGFRKSWWKQTWERITSRFRGTRASRDPFPTPPPPIRMPTLLDVHEPSEEFSFETPALGDAFNFRVRVRCSWTVQATAPEDSEEMEKKIAEVREFIEKSREITRDRIEERVRPLARNYPPYRAAEAEKALNDTLSDCLNDGDVRVTVRTWVDVSDPVREDLQKVWRERLVADGGRELESELRKAHVVLLGELQEAWQGLLRDGLEGMGAVDEAKTTWLAPYALALAEDPKNAAGYLKDVLERRVDHAERLLADLGALAIDDRVEAIEFAFQSQSALLALLTYLGVPVPAQNGASRGLGGVADA